MDEGPREDGEHLLAEVQQVDDQVQSIATAEACANHKKNERCMIRRTSQSRNHSYQKKATKYVNREHVLAKIAKNCSCTYIAFRICDKLLCQGSSRPPRGILDHHGGTSLKQRGGRGNLLVVLLCPLLLSLRFLLLPPHPYLEYLIIKTPCPTSASSTLPLPLSSPPRLLACSRLPSSSPPHPPTTKSSGRHHHHHARQQPHHPPPPP